MGLKEGRIDEVEGAGEAGVYLAQLIVPKCHKSEGGRKEDDSARRNNVAVLISAISHPHVGVIRGHSGGKDWRKVCLQGEAKMVVNNHSKQSMSALGDPRRRSRRIEVGMKVVGNG